MPMTHERSPDTDAVIIVLRGVNDEVTYANAAKQAGLTLKRFKEVLSSARRILENEKTVFGTIRGVGLRRLGVDQKKLLGIEAQSKIGRAAKRGIKKLETITGNEFASLAPPGQLMVTTSKTVLNLIRQEASVKAEPPKDRPKPPAMSIENIIKLNKKAQQK